MKTFAVMGIAAAAFISIGSMGSVAQAQDVGIGVGPGGIGVHVDDGYHHGWREREYRRQRAEYRDYRRREWERRHWRHRDRDRVYIERD